MVDLPASKKQMDKSQTSICGQCWYSRIGRGLANVPTCPIKTMFMCSFESSFFIGGNSTLIASVGFSSSSMASSSITFKREFLLVADLTLLLY